MLNYHFVNGSPHTLVRFLCALKTRQRLLVDLSRRRHFPSAMVTPSSLSRLATSTAFWFSFSLLAVSYLFLAPRCTTIKQRAWVLTLLSSAAMSLFSLPLVVQYASAGGQLKHLAIPPIITECIGRFFQAYLIVLVQSMLCLLQCDQSVLVT